MYTSYSDPMRAMYPCIIKYPCRYVYYAMSFNLGVVAFLVLAFAYYILMAS